jgi:hypothetical protein
MHTSLYYIHATCVYGVDCVVEYSIYEDDIRVIVD